MRIEQLRSEDQKAYSEFVAQHPYGCIEQTLEWGELQTSIEGRPDYFVFVVKSGEDIVASAMVLRQIMGKGRSWLWCPGGPLLSQDEPAESWRRLKEELTATARLGGDVFLRMEPLVPIGETWPVQGKWVKESYLPRHTLQIDLSRDLDDIRKDMKQKGRYNIKQASKTGVYIQKADDDDVGPFYDILKETAKRDGFHLHDRDFYQNFLDILGKDAVLYLAYHEHDLLGGLMATHFGDRATYYFGASSDDHRQKMAPYALQWFAIQQAKTAGFLHYDLLGIAPPKARSHPLKGVTQFKTRFGGEYVEYHPARVLVFRRFWWAIYRLAKCVRRLRRR